MFNFIDFYFMNINLTEIPSLLINSTERLFLKNYPKSSNIIDSRSTPMEPSMPCTAFDIGPGPHM